MAAIDRRLLRASRATRIHLVVATLLAAATAACAIAQAVLLARIVARVFLGGAGLGDVRPELIGLAAAFAARALVGAAMELSGHVGAARAMSELRRRLVAQLLRRRPGAVEGERSGELAAAAVQGVDALDAYFSRYLPQLALALVVPLAILAWVATVDLTSALIMLATLPLIPVFMILIGLAARARARARWKALASFGGHFLDVVRGLETLRACNRAEAQVETIRSVGERLRRETMATLRVAFLSALVLELAATLSIAVLAVTIGVRLAEGGMRFEDGLLALLLAPELYLPLRQLGAQFHASADGMAAADRIFAALDAPAALPEPAPGALAPPARPGAIRLEGVGFSYPGRAAPALAGVDLELRAGERVALVGGNGSGKSTLARLLLRLADPSEGRILVDGRDVRELDPEAWRRLVAWVPQRPHLFAASVADNVRLGDPRASRERVWEALEQAGARGFVEALPAGLETRVGDGGRELSAGERQRLALARAFLRPAPVVILDEPTASLDDRTAGAVEEAIERLCAGRIALLVVHRPGLARGADRVVRLEGGRLAASPASEAAAALPAAVAA